ncbi:uncharacterized protein LOC123015991 [Tribolium madens]|uniref:uncharacterized protein LOC123015991 n=1 Tax=Tribolium madens TaxID=41895 RepID=UPI001CF754E5|nr:uncharacterized protein LOC123015991 [Tribolium madens]
MSRQMSLVITNNNLSTREWLVGVTDETTILSLPLETSESSPWSGNFVPPPPRPLFLDEGVTPDGLTTCDLCSWAWQKENSYVTDTKLEASNELGWVLTLVIVSLVSAVLGAIVMIIVLHCKRLKNPNANVSQVPPSTLERSPVSDDKSLNIQNFAPNPNNMTGVWSWLSRRSTGGPSQLENPALSFVENHYTHMEDPYNSVDDALYAELEGNTGSSAYNNSAYADPDAPSSSAPSSAYYSDLSVTTVPDRAYEVVGLATMPVWDGEKAPRLAVISETVTVPSDYV